MKIKKSILVTKASGDKIPFIEDKLRNSLIRSGANEKQINEIFNEVSSQLYEGISTKKIYRLAFNKLKDRSKHLAARYHLKQGIMELGPSGYPFERFIGEILKQQGYSVHCLSPPLCFLPWRQIRHCSSRNSSSCLGEPYQHWREQRGL